MDPHFYIVFLLQINTPNADKNIYGNSQFNSSLEMSRINTNGTNDLSPAFMQNIERTSLLKIPHYTLQDVEFVEELGEGAFGINNFHLPTS